jgi:autonomous glycyl radical cofactor GrcA
MTGSFGCRSVVRRAGYCNVSIVESSEVDGVADVDDVADVEPTVLAEGCDELELSL